MNKQIKEKELPVAIYMSGHGLDWADSDDIANQLYEQGYRKIPEGSVVLDHDEAQKYCAYKIIEPQIKGCLDRELALEKQLKEARKKALDLALILSEVIEKLNVCTLKLENKSQEFTNGYTKAIAEVRNSIVELTKNLE